jgi:hypothetical protein
MRCAGLPDGYADALGTGLWPSCDVLPFNEIRERGVAIEAGSIEFQPCRSASGKSSRKSSARTSNQWPKEDRAARPRLSDKKFKDPALTAAGEIRASVALEQLRTLWINTGTLCNITCRNCYIESSPKNDRLAYITTSEVAAYLDEIAEQGLATEEVGFTGGEPFMNPDIIARCNGTRKHCCDSIVSTVPGSRSGCRWITIRRSVTKKSAVPARSPVRSQA